MSAKVWRNPTTWVYVLVHLVLVSVGYLGTITGESLLIHAVGASLVASGVVGLAVAVYIFQTNEIRARLETLHTSGLLAVLNKRGHSVREEYEGRVNRAGRSIDIMGFGLSSLWEDFGGRFPEWKIRAKVRVLLLDPEFPNTRLSYANQRDIEEGSAAHKIKADVRKFLEKTATLRDSRFEVRLYRCLPSVNIFRVDDEILWGPYLVNRVSRNTMTLVCRSGGGMFGSLVEHFDQIWGSEELSRAP